MSWEPRLHTMSSCMTKTENVFSAKTLSFMVSVNQIQEMPYFLKIKIKWGIFVEYHTHIIPDKIGSNWTNSFRWENQNVKCFSQWWQWLTIRGTDKSYDNKKHIILSTFVITNCLCQNTDKSITKGYKIEDFNVEIIAQEKFEKHYRALMPSIKIRIISIQSTKWISNNICTVIIF